MKLRNTSSLANFGPGLVTRGASPSTSFGIRLGLLAPLLLLGACAEKVEQAGPQEEVLPDIKVTLPAAPNFDEARAPVKWEDDSFSIYGLRKDIDDHLKDGAANKEIIVKGWVQEIYVPPECPANELCPPGKQPHFWITDQENELGKKRAMMVVNYYFPIADWDTDTQNLWKGVPLVVVEVGKQYTIKGKFKRFSDTGFAHDNGLLEFVSYKVPNPDPKAENPGELVWIAPPNSDWHPQTLAAEQAQQALTQERMQRDAAQAAKKKKGD